MQHVESQNLIPGPLVLTGPFSLFTSWSALHLKGPCWPSHVWTHQPTHSSPFSPPANYRANLVFGSRGTCTSKVKCRNPGKGSPNGLGPFGLGVQGSWFFGVWFKEGSLGFSWAHPLAPMGRAWLEGGCSRDPKMGAPRQGAQDRGPPLAWVKDHNAAGPWEVTGICFLGLP